MVARSVAHARTGVALRTRARPSTRSTRRHAREVDSRFGGARGVAPPSRDGFPESSRTLFPPFAARRWVVPRRRAARPPSRGGRPRAGRPRPTRPAANAFVRVVETIGGVVARGNSPGRARSRPRSRGDRPRPPPRQRPAGRTGAPGKKTLNASGRATSRSRRRRPPSRPPRRLRTPSEPHPRPRRAPPPRSLPPGRRTDPPVPPSLPPSQRATTSDRSHTRRRPPPRHGIRRPRRPLRRSHGRPRGARLAAPRRRLPRPRRRHHRKLVRRAVLHRAPHQPQLSPSLLQRRVLAHHRRRRPRRPGDGSHPARYQR